MTWTQAVSLNDLGDKPVVFNHPPRQIAVFAIDDRVFAVDNRCPHEGYPLAEGNVTDDCVLTCNWHNWKFRLSDGECLLGGDNVRSYPTRRQDGHVWVDISDPPPEEIRRQVLRGLKVAVEDRDFGRLCREIARLHYHELDPKDAVLAALEWTHARLEFGTTHAMAATADWLALADSLSGGFEDRLICLAEAVDHLAFDSLRRREYPYAAAGEPFEAAAFCAAIESEQNDVAEGMVARGMIDGLRWNDMEEAFAAAALAHYNDFGHSLIYVAKTGQLLESLGAEAAPFLLPALARHIAYATREDLIPEFKDYGPALESLPGPGTKQTDGTKLEIPFPKTKSQALGWLRDNIGTFGNEAVYDALLEALGLNLLHYDTSYGTAHDRPVSQNIGWLDFTHGLTFSNAARTLCTQYPHLWPQALVQMACFQGRNRKFVDRTVDKEEWRVEEPSSFFVEARDRLLDHGLRDPIFSAHLLKTSAAVQAELPYVSDSCADALLAGLNRFLHSPIKMKHVRRLARQAIALVARDFDSKPGE